MVEDSAAKGRIPLHYKILVGLAAGAAGGAAARSLWPGSPALQWTVENVALPIGQVFLRLIFMTVIPLIFSALALGAAEFRDFKTLGRVGLRTLAATLLLSGVAVLIGITLVNVFRPGEGLSPEAQETLRRTVAEDAGRTHVERAKEAKSAVQTLVDFVPQNPLQEAVFAFSAAHRGGGLLAVMFFALVFGAGMAASPRESVEPVARFLEGVFAVLMKIIGFAMNLAPYGVAALMFAMTARLGLDAMASLGKYVAVAAAGLALHQFGTYSLALKFLARRSPAEFFRQAREMMLVAFGTSSSNATLPVALRVVRENMGVPSDVTRFVMTLGSTANQNGTALFEGVTVLFLAQFFGVELSLGSQFLVVFMAILAGVGTAGVPGGSLPVIVILLESVGVPGAGIGVILGVDRFLDMCRTAVNVTGDAVVAVCVARGEAAASRQPPAASGT